MTPQEAKKMLKAKLECLKNETSGINHDCNMRLCDECSLNYEQGNMGEQKEALDMAIKALEQIRWIPVSERLPEEYISVLVWCPERKNIYCAYYKNKEWFIFGGYNHCLEEVIAWMPLPEPKKESDSDDQ